MLKMNRRNLLQGMAGSLAFPAIGLSYEPRVIAKSSLATEVSPPLNDEWLNDIIWVKANAISGHHSTVRLSLPSNSDYKNPKLFTYFDSLGQVKKEKLFDELFYGGNTFVDPLRITGLSRRYSTCDYKLAQCSVNVIDAGGKKSGALTSAWVIVWSPQTIFGITPDGLAPRNDGKVGIVTLDYRYAARVANIDETSDIEALLSRAMLRLPTFHGNAIIYVNNNLFTRMSQVDKFRKIKVRNVPLRSDEALVI